VSVATPPRRGRPALRQAGAYLYLLPAGLLLIGVFAIPLVDSVVLSLHKSAGLAGTSGWAGTSNYKDELSSSVFWNIARQTAVWTIGVVVITTVASLFLASLLRKPFRGRTLFRVLIMFPWASSLAISSVIWKFALEPNGLVDRSLELVGLRSLIRPWLANTPQATIVLILVGVWASVPFTTVILSAGMRAIPDELYEAFSLESSNPFRRDWYITIPLLRSVLLISLMSNFIVVFNSFPIIYVMTGGGPVNKTDILATYLYETAFADLDIGHASAIAILVSVVLLVLTFIYIRLLVYRRSDISSIGSRAQAERAAR
jgi:multiple sugar transport system permease protein